MIDTLIVVMAFISLFAFAHRIFAYVLDKFLQKTLSNADMLYEQYIAAAEELEEEHSENPALMQIARELAQAGNEILPQLYKYQRALYQLMDQASVGFVNGDPQEVARMRRLNQTNGEVTEITQEYRAIAKTLPAFLRKTEHQTPQNNLYLRLTQLKGRAGHFIERHNTALQSIAPSPAANSPVEPSQTA